MEMKGGLHLTTKEKSVIVGKSHAGMSQYRIAADLGIPRSSIEYVLKRFQDHGTVVTRKANIAR